MHRPKLGDRKLTVLFTKHTVFGQRCAMDLMATIRIMLHKFRRNLLGEKYLPNVRSVPSLVRSSRSMPAHANLEMDVVRASHVETWKHRAKTDAPICSCELYPAEEGEFVGRCMVWRRSHRLWSANSNVRRGRAKARSWRCQEGRRRDQHFDQRDPWVFVR